MKQLESDILEQDEKRREKLSKKAARKRIEEDEAEELFIEQLTQYQNGELKI